MARERVKYRLLELNRLSTSSALFVLVRKATPDKVLEELAGSGGKVLKSSLSHDDEAKLQAALSTAKGSS